MVDSVVTFALEKVNQLLVREVSLLSGVKEEIKYLHLKLTQISQFLQNSNGKREMVKELLSTIRSVAHRAEDVIDFYVVNMAKNDRRSKVGQVLHTFDHAYMLRSVAIEINSITDEITKIYDNKDRYGIENKEARDDFGQKRKALDRRRCQVEEEEVVSFVNDAKIVMGMLTKTGRRLDVVSIVGMGGLGKTTLAKKIFNDNRTKNVFGCRVWVYVSQEFRTRDLLLNILLSIGVLSTEELHAMNETMLVAELRKCLADKKYLIVLDDVWTSQVWDGVKSAFPDNRKGCRILVTSRVTEVAAHASQRAPYYLPLLNKDDSWELLWRKAFRGEVCPPGLEILGRQIAEKCNGLPLAIVVVAGILATRDKTTRIWSQMADNISWYLKKVPEKFIDILALSYEELPSYLKPCFLYMGFFPEDFEVTVRQLIRLWIAEGFIEQDDTRKVEDIAEEYVEDLVDRSLIMVVRRRSDGGVKSFCIHDLLRDLCISQGMEENFLTVHTELVLSSPSNNISNFSDEKPRRLSIHCGATRYISHAPCDTSMVRSFLGFGEPDELNIKIFRCLYKGFRLLRVLDLGSTIVLTVPTQVEKLIHLRYLRMNAPRLTEFPLPISKLPKLQTLDLKESKIKYFNNSFWTMQQLRHLFLGGDCDIPVIQRGADNRTTMQNLQTLSTISSNAAYNFHGDLFPNLRKLGVRASERCSYSQVTKGRPKFSSVQTLKIIEGSHFLSQQGAFTSSLSKLTLIQTKIGCSVFQRLALLPNLQILKLLKKSLVGPVIECRKGWFPKLEVLHMVELDVVKWELNDNIIHPVSQMSPQILYLRKEVEDMRQVINNRQEEVRENKRVTNTEKEEVKVRRRNLENLQDALERQRKLVSDSLHYRNQKLELDCQMEKLLLSQKQLNESEKELAESEKKLTESEEKLMKAIEPKTLPSLQYLFITKCRDLKEVSGPLKQATTLHHVKVSWCSLVLEGNLRKILGKRVKYEFESYNS